MKLMLLVLLLMGCAQVPDRIETGPVVPAPNGFIEWCDREPWQFACGGAGAPR